MTQENEAVAGDVTVETAESRERRRIDHLEQVDRLRQEAGITMAMLRDGRAKRAILVTELLDRLREPEGATVTFCCDNPDFNSLPNSAIVVIDDWTDHVARRFTGETIVECLLSAETARAEVRK